MKNRDRDDATDRDSEFIVKCFQLEDTLVVTGIDGAY